VTRAAVGLALSGRYAEPATQAARGLEAWARHRGLHLDVVDTGDDVEQVERTYRGLARSAGLLFGPYGSGPLRAAERALAGGDEVLWNHGGAAGDASRPARVIDVLGPAERYWAGLGSYLGRRGVPRDRVGILYADTGFGRATMGGAVASLRAVGVEPLVVRAFGGSVEAAVADVLRAGAAALIGCGRMEDDLALLAAAGPGVAVGAVVCGVGLARRALGAQIVGRFGPAQWLPRSGGPLPAGAEYPAAQAYAAGQVCQAALERAGSDAPRARWDAARSLRIDTVIGPFRVDAQGRQLAHAPLLVEWVPTPGGPERRAVWRPADTGTALAD
jgi:branched-chain amino acid transport system substrate-binding protein